MNGDERDRLTSLETTLRVWVKAHDKRSDEIWKQIQGSIKAIFSKLDGLTCQTHKEKFKSNERQISRLWAIVTAIILSIVGSALWILKK